MQNQHQTLLCMFSNHHLSAFAQKNDIEDMREMLCKQYADCAFVPATGDKRKDQDF